VKVMSGVELAVADSALARAMASVIDDGGEDAGGTVVVRDSVVDDRRGPVVLVADATPAAAASALRALQAGHVVGVVSEDQLEDLTAVVAAVRAGLVVAARRILSLSSAAPQLSDRQAEVLEELLAGGSNAKIAAELHLSEATVKRELAAVGVAFGTTTRVGILAAAYAAGYRPTCKAPV
jgi:DNA-binding NarL/FixJ family response regulator